MATVTSRTFVHVEGLADFRNDLRRASRSMPLGLTRANRAVAKGVAMDARSKAEGQQAIIASAAPAVSWRASQTTAQVRLSKEKIPWAFGAEFGAYRNIPRTRSTGTYLGLNQFLPWRGNSADAGYFMWPTIRDWSESGRIKETYADKLIDEVIFRALETGGSIGVG